nr:MAG TPA: hypothetical protein [Bacteriophage sp.]DAX20405.1 MAG TPA: hypothetical protein [Caudoviricetes sp.]
MVRLIRGRLKISTSSFGVFFIRLKNSIGIYKR